MNCTGGDNDDVCNSVALQYAEGKGIPADLQQAATFDRKACRLGNANACTELKVLGLPL